MRTTLEASLPNYKLIVDGVVNREFGIRVRNPRVYYAVEGMFIDCGYTIIKKIGFRSGPAYEQGKDALSYFYKERREGIFASKTTIYVTSSEPELNGLVTYTMSELKEVYNFDIRNSSRISRAEALRNIRRDKYLQKRYG